MTVTVVKRDINENETEVSVKDMPAFYDLERQVSKLVKSSSWLERYGWDWVTHSMALVGLPIGLILMTSQSIATFLLGTILYGGSQTILATRTGHLAAHGAVCESMTANRFWSWLFGEVIGMFSYKVGIDVHVHQHHPHTNIIGMGDSSIWRAPMLPRCLYFFVLPLSMPVLTPLVSLGGLWGQWRHLVTYVLSASFGFIICLWPLIYLANYSILGAMATIFAARSIFFIPYLHFNVFQHIGLPMYNAKKRPARIYQMATGVMNLHRNPLLDFLFGHTLINCHVEHHLFPRLSDNMCLTVKPMVREFLLKHGMPYNERPYSERLSYFYANYDRLMVKAPPITHFVGMQ